MADQKCLDILKQGVEYWNSWKFKHLGSHIDLSGIDLSFFELSGANLIGVDLSRTDLIGANFSKANLGLADLVGADLSEADFSDADLSNANFSDANLSCANFSFADLSGANLNGANLSKANLRGACLIMADLSDTNLERADLSEADLSGANLSNVRLLKTAFAENDLCTVKGLLEIDHQGQSCVELYTVKLLPDGSALHFLRGAGVPDEWIGFYRVTMMMPIQYHSCFISYAHQDELLARRLLTVNHFGPSPKKVSLLADTTSAL